MKTDQLIAALAADRTAPAPLVRRLGLALMAGGAVSLGVFLAYFGPRADLATAVATWRFELKVALMAFTVVLAFGVCRAMARPVQPPHPARRLLLAVAAMSAALALELAIAPSDSWGRRLVGTNSLICLSAIPLFSLGPLVAVIAILRSGAPTSPVLAGAAGGLLAAAAGATLYAFHCFDDSPLFVATWYSLAAIPVVAVGALAGYRFLRW